jgi:membrane protein
MQELWTFLKSIFRAWSEDSPPRLAAALAYYSMFSLAPVIFIAVTVASAFVDELAVTNQLFTQFENTVGTETAKFVQDLVVDLSQRTSAGSPLTTLVGFGVLLYAASGLFSHLKYALNTIWHVPPSAHSGPVAFVKGRLLAFLLVIGVGMLLVLTALFGVLFSVLRSYLDLGGSGILENVAVSLSLATFSFAIIFKILPDVDIAWRDVWVGALVTALLFEIGGVLVGFYLGRSNFASGFEAAGALVVLLIAIYYFAQMFLFGAVFTRIYASTFGSQRQLVSDDENHASAG